MKCVEGLITEEIKGFLKANEFTYSIINKLTL
jgi:hypothetical protein